MINVAIVGCGYWGPNLIRNFHQLGECRLAMCCDLDAERLAAIQMSYPTVATTTRFQEVLESSEIDAIVLATPAKTHYSLAQQALTCGKHLLVEKPLAMTSVQCEELICLAAQQDRVLMVGHTFMYNPAMLKVKELARPDYLGDLFYLYSHRVNLGQVQTDINALWSIAPHDISIALYLVGQPPLEVSAQGACYLKQDTEDVVFVTLTFIGGITGHIHVSWIDPSKTRKVTIIGSRRMIVYDDLADEAKVKVYDKGVLRVDGGQLSGQLQFHYRVHSGDIYAPQIEMTEPLANQCGHFIKCIQEGKRPLTDGQSGLEVVRVLEAAQRSLKQHGAPVKVPMEPVVA